MCWEVRHADILILLLAGSILIYGSKEGWLHSPLPPAEKSNAFSPKDPQSFLYHPSETSGDSRTLVTIPYVILCSIFSHYYASVLTSLRRELAPLCQAPRAAPEGRALGGWGLPSPC